MSATKIHELHLCTGHAVLGSYYTNHSIFHVKVAQFYAGVRGIPTQLSNLSPATFWMNIWKPFFPGCYYQHNAGKIGFVFLKPAAGA